MDETTQMPDVVPKPKPKNTGSLKLICALLVVIALLLGALLVLMEVKENRVLAELMSNTQNAKIECQAAMAEFYKIPNSNIISIPFAAEAEKLLTKGDSLENEKKFKEATEAFDKSKASYMKAAKVISKYNELSTSVNEMENNLPIFESVAPSFPNYKEIELEKLSKQLEEIKAFVAELEFDKSVTLIEGFKANFTNLENNLKKKVEELEEQWAITKKEDNKESYQVFVGSYPHSKYIKTANKRITEIDAALKAKKEAAELAQKKKEEELRIEQAKIDARKAALEKEMKMKRELEQVVTMDFEDGSSYTGQLNIEKKPHGEGTYSYTNSNVYRGKWKDGLYHGEGTYDFYTGVTYKGEWSEGKRHGKGTVTWKNGDKFIGSWKDGELHGRGIWISKAGMKKVTSFFEGEELGNLSLEAYQKKKDLQKERLEKNRLSKKEKKAYLFHKRFQDGLEILRKENPTILFPDLPVHIPRNESYAAGRMMSRDAEKHELLLKELFFEQKRYLMVTKKSLDKDEIGESASAEFGGYTIRTASLGVILDNSGSMTSYLPRLRKKIEDKFSKSAFIEVTGCNISSTQGMEITKDNAASGTVAAIKFLVNEKGCDTIYWFSDLNDGETPEGLEDLKDFLYKNFVTFYISSVGYKPSKELKEIIDDSGGKVLRF